MVNVMDYSCPVCGGKDPECQSCEGTGRVRMLCGTIPTDGPECPGCDCPGDCTPCEYVETKPLATYEWHTEFVGWYFTTRGHLPAPLDPVAEAAERAFHAGWVAKGGDNA